MIGFLLHEFIRLKILHFVVSSPSIGSYTQNINPKNIFEDLQFTIVAKTGGFKTIGQSRRKHTKECNARKIIMV